MNAGSQDPKALWKQAHTRKPTLLSGPVDQLKRQRICALYFGQLAQYITLNIAKPKDELSLPKEEFNNLTPNIKFNHTKIMNNNILKNL